MYLVPFALLKGSSSNEFLYEMFSLLCVPSLASLRVSQKHSNPGVALPYCDAGSVATVVPTNLPPASPCRRLSRHSPAHKVSWDGGDSHAPAEARRRDEREDQWSQRAFEMGRTDAGEGQTAHSEVSSRRQCFKKKVCSRG